MVQCQAEVLPEHADAGGITVEAPQSACVNQPVTTHSAFSILWAVQPPPIFYNVFVQRVGGKMDQGQARYTQWDIWSSSLSRVVRKAGRHACASMQISPPKSVSGKCSFTLATCRTGNHVHQIAYSAPEKTTEVAAGRTFAGHTFESLMSREILPYKITKHSIQG